MPRKASKKKLGRPALERIARVFAAFADPTRLAILQELRSEARSVGELVEEVGGSQGNMSKQLALLFESGLLHREKRGNQVFYSLRDEMVVAMCELVCERLNRDLEDSSALSFQI